MSSKDSLQLISVCYYFYIIAHYTNGSKPSGYPIAGTDARVMSYVHVVIAAEPTEGSDTRGGASFLAA